MTQDPRGMIQQQGNIMRIDNAFVEEVSNPDFSSTGFIIISYAAPGAGRSVTIQTLQLNVSRNTVILNSRGQRLSLYRIRKGMWVNVVFSARQTRSIPPQANAYLIIVRQDIQQPTDFTIARIASVDPENGFLVTGNPSGAAPRTNGQNYTCYIPDRKHSTTDDSFSCTTPVVCGAGIHSVRTVPKTG